MNLTAALYLTGSYSVLRTRIVRFHDHYLTQTDFRHMVICLGGQP